MSLLAVMNSNQNQQGESVELVTLTNTVTIPDYPPIILNIHGNAELPCNFLPAMIDKLPDHCSALAR